MKRLTDIDIDLEGLIWQLLPPKKRHPKRMAWINSLLAPLKLSLEDFKDKREQLWIAANTNSQTCKLEWYLNYMLCKGKTLITIQHDNRFEQQQFIPLQKEGLATLFMHLQKEGTGGVVFPNQATTAGMVSNKDFVVNAPDFVADTKIHELIKKYNLAGKTYEILKYTFS